MPTLRRFTAGALLLFAVTAAAQTEYFSGRDPAMQRLGRQLQADQLADARRDLADYLTQLPGDAIMQYNLACLDAVFGDTASALARLDRALAAGYRDLERPLHDPDLAILADDPRLTAKLDSARAILVDEMQRAAFFLEESIWSEPMSLVPDPFGPGAQADSGQCRVHFDAEALVFEIAPPPGGADEIIACIALPTDLDTHETRRWFEFRARLDTPGPVPRTARHGRLDADTGAARLERDGEVWLLTIPWTSLHPYRPPVELVLGMNVVLRRETGAVPADRWALIRDPHAASTVQPWRRFAPATLDPGLEPTPLITGRCDTYLVIGDSLTVELGIQGLPGGPTTVAQYTGTATPDTIFSVIIDPDLSYLTLDFALPTEPPNGWFDLAVQLTAPDGGIFHWQDRGFRLQPDWFIVQNERLAGVREIERPIVQYQLFGALRGQQSFQPHDDPTALARAALTTETLLDRAEATGSVLPAEAGDFEVAFPAGDDALQSCRLVLPIAARRRGAELVVVVTADRRQTAIVAADLAVARAEDETGQFLVLGAPLVPGRADLGAAVVVNALAWVRELLDVATVGLVGTGEIASVALQAAMLSDGTVEAVLLFTAASPLPGDSLPFPVTVVSDAGDDPAAWAARVREWD